jgi:pyruvate,water dikinase
MSLRPAGRASTRYAPGSDSGDGVLSGSPVSPGVVEGVVHVVFDPRGAQLAPGEILVCPGTDPSWTPLFLAAGGLVMEVGGLMTHGSVVAREYGIPAVVGVHEATSRLQSGQRVRVDGTAGRVVVVGGRENGELVNGEWCNEETRGADSGVSCVIGLLLV